MPESQIVALQKTMVTKRWRKMRFTVCIIVPCIDVIVLLKNVA